ncbi:hypothetical protein [Salinisphaera shabanensis]
MANLTDVVPNRQFWLLFKISSKERLIAMQRGLLYMNSLAYFAGIEGESSDSLRGDPDEPVLARVRGGQHGEYIYKFTLTVGDGSNKQQFDVTENSVMQVTVPSPSNVMVFCFSALADGSDGTMPGEANGELWLDQRLEQFGDHLLLIRDARVLSDRISKAVAAHRGLYDSEYFQGGYGRVEYGDADSGPETLGLFHKPKRYEWQREFRFVLGADQRYLNKKGALELQIGDISDITDLIPLQKLFESPFKISRRLVKKVGDEYVDV